MAGEEKTEKATPKKRKDQRKEGNVLQSKEIGIAASVLGIFAAMRLLLGFISENIFSYTGSVFEELGSTYVTTDNIMTIWVDVITVFGITVGPVCLIAIFLGIIPTIAQTRGLFTMKALKPKFSRLNPLSGIKKLFSLQSRAIGCSLLRPLRLPFVFAHRSSSPPVASTGFMPIG